MEELGLQVQQVRMVLEKQTKVFLDVKDMQEVFNVEAVAVALQ